MVVNGRVSVGFNNQEKHNDGFALKFWWQPWAECFQETKSKSCKSLRGREWMGAECTVEDWKQGVEKDARKASWDGGSSEKYSLNISLGKNRERKAENE